MASIYRRCRAISAVSFPHHRSAPASQLRQYLQIKLRNAIEIDLPERYFFLERGLIVEILPTIDEHNKVAVFLCPGIEIVECQCQAQPARVVIKPTNRKKVSPFAGWLMHPVESRSPLCIDPKNNVLTFFCGVLRWIRTANIEASVVAERATTETS